MKHKLTKSTVSTVPFFCRDDITKTDKSGFTIRFEAFPEIPVFIAQNDRGFWHRFDPVTGLKFGSEATKTRKAMIAETFGFLDGMLNAPKHKGSMASLLAFIKHCQDYSLKNCNETSGPALK